MAKIVMEFETDFDKGEVVIFKKKDKLMVGVIEGYYEDDGYIWYNIRTGKNNVYTYSNGGDIGEFDIICSLDKEDAEKCLEEMKEIDG